MTRCSPVLVHRFPERMPFHLGIWQIIISVRRSKILVESGCTAFPAPDTPKSEPSMEFRTELLGTWDLVDAPCHVVSVEELVWCRTTSRPPEGAMELDRERLEPLGIRAYPQMLGGRTRPWSADVSGGRVVLPPSALVG